MPAARVARPAPVALAARACRARRGLQRPAPRAAAAARARARPPPRAAPPGLAKPAPAAKPAPVPKPPPKAPSPRPENPGPNGPRSTGTVKTKKEGVHKWKNKGDKYVSGFIAPDDGSEDIFFMSRGDDGLLLEVGQRVSYVQETNARGPIAHYAKPIEDAAAAPAPADFPALAKPGPWGTATSPKAAPKPPPAPPVKKPKLRGTVTAVRPREAPSYGFVRPDAGGDDVFVAFVDVESAPGKLAEGDRVDYELVPNAGARKSNRTSGDPKYAVKCGHVVVLPKGAPKLGAPKASAGPAHLRRAPPPLRRQGPARQGHGPVVGPGAAGARAAPGRHAGVGARVRGRPAAPGPAPVHRRPAAPGLAARPPLNDVDEDQLAAELESLREKHDRELANLRQSHNREMGQLQERHAALTDPVGALLSSTGCGQYRQKFAEQDIVSKADFDMLRMEDLLEVGLEQREADALAAALGIDRRLRRLGAYVRQLFGAGGVPGGCACAAAAFARAHARWRTNMARRCAPFM